MQARIMRVQLAVVTTALVALCVVGISPASALAVATPGSPNTISGFVRDTSGTPIPSAFVEVIGYDAKTDMWNNVGDRFSGPAVDGSYIVENIPAGSYRVFFMDIEAWPGWLPISAHTPQLWNGHNIYPSWYVLAAEEDSPYQPVDLVTVPAVGPGPTGINASMTPEPASISGHVRDADGNPAANVSATVYGHSIGDGISSQWEPLFSVPVAADGSYVMRGLFPMTYYVGFSDEASGTWNRQYYRDSPLFGSATSLDCSGTLNTDIDATMTPASVCVTGTVTDAVTGAPLGGMKVEASSDETDSDFPPLDVHATSLADGSYELRGLIPGRQYWIWSTDPESRHAFGSTGGASVFSGSMLRANLAMKPVPAFESFDGENFDYISGQLLESQYDYDYTDLKDVVLTSGDWEYSGEAINAPGLCWAYQVTKAGSPNLGKNAPLVTIASANDVAAEQTPEAAKAITDIALENGTPDHRLVVHVVGTARALPDAKLRRIRSYAASHGAKVSVERVVRVAKADAFDLAEAVAHRMKQRASASRTDAIRWSGIAFVVNYDDTLGAMSACAVAAARGAIMLPVLPGVIPKPTARIVKSLSISRGNTWIVGDTRSVSAKVRKKMHLPTAHRLQGRGTRSTCFTVAAAVARLALARGWLSDKSVVAIASTDPDAVIAAAAAGDAGGPLLEEETQWEDDRAETTTWVDAHSTHISALWFVGDDASSHADSYKSRLGIDPRN